MDRGGRWRRGPPLRVSIRCASAQPRLRSGRKGSGSVTEYKHNIEALSYINECIYCNMKPDNCKTNESSTYSV